MQQHEISEILNKNGIKVFPTYDRKLKKHFVEYSINNKIIRINKSITLTQLNKFDKNNPLLKTREYLIKKYNL